MACFRSSSPTESSGEGSWRARSRRAGVTSPTLTHHQQTLNSSSSTCDALTLCPSSPPSDHGRHPATLLLPFPLDPRPCAHSYSFARSMQQVDQHVNPARL
eukprot:754163-Hanusia_phi.AAC.2